MCHIKGQDNVTEDALPGALLPDTSLGFRLKGGVWVTFKLVGNISMLLSKQV